MRVLLIGRDGIWFVPVVGDPCHSIDDYMHLEGTFTNASVGCPRGGVRSSNGELMRMKRALLAILMTTAAMGPNVPATARVVRSGCAGEIHPSGPHHCTVIFGGPATATGTAAPGPDGRAEIHLVIEIDIGVRMGSDPLVPPMLLAECSAVAVDGPATCTAEWHGNLDLLPIDVVQQYQGSGTSRCTATGTVGTFTCEGGTV